MTADQHINMLALYCTACILCYSGAITLDPDRTAKRNYRRINGNRSAGRQLGAGCSKAVGSAVADRTWTVMRNLEGSLSDDAG